MGTFRVAVLVGLVVGGVTWAKKPMEPPALNMTPSRTWSRAGWQNLKWGMGSENVRLVLESMAHRSEYHHDSENSYISPSRFMALLDDEIDGCRVGISAMLSAGRLNRIYLSVLDCDEEPIKTQERAEYAHFKMFRLLELKYGTPKKTDLVAGVLTAKWELKLVHVLLVTHPADEESTEPHVSVRYFDPIASDEFFNAALENIEKRKKAEASKL